jgi:hypothetical protein
MARPAPIRAALLLAASLAAAPAFAQEWQPYPQPKITVEQWKAYLATVREYLESTAEIYKDKGVVVFSNPDTRTFYIFTTKDNPAHPAWITRQLVEEKGQVNVRQIGFYAGKEEAFDKMFREYLQRNEELKKEVEKRNQ